MLTVVIEAIVRIVLIATTGPSHLDMTFLQYAATFGAGFLADAAFAIMALLPLFFFTITVGNGKYRSPFGWIILGLLLMALIYLGWFCPALQDFNRGLARVVRWVLIYWIASFALRMNLANIRQAWTRTWLAIIIGIYILIIYLNATSEYFFWNEFEVRYNFIAVDYLVYTQEVIGNIMESYPIIPLACLVVAVAAVTEWLLFGKLIKSCNVLYEKYSRAKVTLIYVAAVCVAGLTMMALSNLKRSSNNYYNELRANGPCCFFEAFLKNRLDFHQFYPTLPTEEANEIIKDITSTATDSIALPTTGVNFQKMPNIVLITMESMSADYMNRFGNDGNLTPTLDSLYNTGIAFDRMIACGNRTVRGLEALTLSLPPSAGQSLIKRPECQPKGSVGEVLRANGYKTIFLYGGKSYFDNMGPFFRNAGYDVVDIDNFQPSEITFSNIWGVCDEDAYNKLLHILDESSTDGAPVFAHMMTISNHRPYTYPDGRIDIPADAKIREGGVKYSDYALGKFMRDASTKPWFDNTIFIIVADHCASSAGSTDLPVRNYHIPALIHAPALIQPKAIDYTVSQIDLMPTALSLTGIPVDSFIYGRNALSSTYHPRAFLATYQDLGYIDDNILTVLSPGKRIRQYTIDHSNRFESESTPLTVADSLKIKRAISFYQTTADRTE
ncbi:MAG: sulfatase-like hydrolase/transferase [Bacteroides sp.]|nr:sulfatase-like hydrolase/transferase [Bacteroides sp.]MCM1413453.1 sulfatase-like hydrolase/transferase [Bacteroides sp.]MCM1471336.1 sulfatase-like hydrolase/transferase [Bacteroides sp.]